MWFGAYEIKKNNKKIIKNNVNNFSFKYKYALLIIDEDLRLGWSN